MAIAHFTRLAPLASWSVSSGSLGLRRVSESLSANTPETEERTVSRGRFPSTFCRALAFLFVTSGAVADFERRVTQCVKSVELSGKPCNQNGAHGMQWQRDMERLLLFPPS